MRILFLAQRVPYPPNRGDKITTWRLLERMRRQHEVRVIAFAHDDADRAASPIALSVIVPLIVYEPGVPACQSSRMPTKLGRLGLR